MRKHLVNLALVAAIVVIVGAALVIAGGSEFGGSDGAATDAITAGSPQYEPWFSPFWAPETQIESGLFALQAALGAGFLGFILGSLRERRRSRDGR